MRSNDGQHSAFLIGSAIGTDLKRDAGALLAILIGMVFTVKMLFVGKQEACNGLWTLFLQCTYSEGPLRAGTGLECSERQVIAEQIMQFSYGLTVGSLCNQLQRSITRLNMPIARFHSNRLHVCAQCFAPLRVRFRATCLELRLQHMSIRWCSNSDCCMDAIKGAQK